MSEQPHDNLFHRVFGDLEHATSYLRAFLPKDLVAAINFSTLRALPRHFVNRNLKRSEADLLYAVNVYEQQALIYILWEHQSSPDHEMPLRLLCYLGEIWFWWRKENPRPAKLPVIVPIVLYHGARPWDAPLNFRKMVDIPCSLRGLVEPYIPDFVYQLNDLRERSDIELMQLALTACARITLRLFKHIRDPDLGQQLPNLFEEIRPWLETIKGLQEFTVMINYVVKASEIVTPQQLQQLEKRLGPRAKGAIMTLAELWQAEGEARGREEGLAEGLRKGEARGEAKGKAEGKASAIIDVLSARGIAITDNARQHIIACRDLATLDQWLKRALVVNSAKELLSDC